MTSKQDRLKTFQSLLTDQKNLLIPQLNRVELPTENYGGDDADIQSAIHENKMEIDRLKKLGIQLRKIDRALLKIRDKSFGICESCKEEIEDSRLSNSPLVELCITCKEDEEQSAHAFGRSSRVFV
jgi:RNA polymerase-binding protein DksA